MVEGKDVLIPPGLMRILPGCLTHMVRNCLAHGIEDPEKREEIVFTKGAHKLFRNVAKSMTGVSATTTGGTVAVGLIGMVMLVGLAAKNAILIVEFAKMRYDQGESVIDAAVNASHQRLRPIMMTMLVATLGLLPAATSHGIGSDSQRPFAIVIVGGLVTALLMSIFLLPTLYVWIARPGDRLPQPDMSFVEED